MSDVYEVSRQLATGQRDHGLIDDRQHSNVMQMIAMCERRRIVPANGLVFDLWGFGHVPVAFTSLDNHDSWIALADLAGPAGSVSDLHIEWDREHAEREDVDTAGWKAQVDCFDAINLDGRFVRTKFVSNTFVMHLMAGVSPWAEEFRANIDGLMHAAFVKSGLADLFDQVPAYVEALDENGKTILVPSGGSLADAARANLPDEAAARARAFSGPAGALTQDGSDT